MLNFLFLTQAAAKIMIKKKKVTFLDIFKEVMIYVNVLFVWSTARLLTRSTGNSMG